MPARARRVTVTRGPGARSRSALLSLKVHMTQLRHLALSIEEHDHDDFFWTILETMTDHAGWAEHSSAVHGFRTWKEAWNAGNVEYLKLVKDPRVGPRFRAAAPT